MDAIQSPLLTEATLDRPRLLDKLHAAMPLRLVALFAPTGYGKTTLVEQWLDDLDPSFGLSRLSIHQYDSDPARFWTDLSRCVERLGAPVDARLLDDLQTDLSAASAAIVKQLMALDGHRLIVLDDLHRIENAHLLRSIFRLVSALPPTVTMVAQSRTSPGWPLAKLKAMGKAVVLGMDDLAFTAEETASLVRATAGSSAIDPSILDTVQTQTDGWPALVDLAVDELGTDGERLRFDDGGRALARRLAGFLSDEILAPLSPEQRRFLQDVSVVERFPVSLARALVGPAAAELTDSLAPTMVLAEDGARTGWYTAHPLIRELLLAQLRENSPPRHRLMQYQAGKWHQAHGDVSTAIEHLIVAGEVDDAMPLLDRSIEPANLDWVDLHAAHAAPTDFFDLVGRSIGTSPGARGRAPTGAAHGITRRESDVVRLLDTRLTYGEMAAELHVSVNTVKSHLRRVYRKLGAASRNEAIVRCHELGLQSSPG